MTLKIKTSVSSKKHVGGRDMCFINNKKDKRPFQTEIISQHEQCLAEYRKHNKMAFQSLRG